MSGNQVCTGYLDVKVSAKSRRGLTPWKAWHKQWCEIQRLDNTDDGAELKLKTSPEGAVISCVVLPRSSTVCRIESRSKQYAFGIFTSGRSHKPLLYLSGSCESDAQKWIEIIRKTLSVSLYIPISTLSFHVSIVDDDEEDDDDISFIDDIQVECKIPRGESGISLASGVYEEIPETPPSDKKKNNKTKENVNIYTNGYMAHVYEDPDVLSTAISFKCDPPPLPPRIFSNIEKNCDTNKDEDNISIKSALAINSFISNTHKYQSSTLPLPSKDLKRLSQALTNDSDYMVMKMPKNNTINNTQKNKLKTKTSLVPEGIYVPMSPIVNNIKTKLENCYMIMSGKKC